MNECTIVSEHGKSTKQCRLFRDDEAEMLWLRKERLELIEAALVHTQIHLHHLKTPIITEYSFSKSRRNS